MKTWLMGDGRAFCGLYLMAVILMLAGCSSSDDVPLVQSPGQINNSLDGFIVPSVVDASLGNGSGIDETGQYLQPCDDNQDCLSGWCVPSLSGTVCSRVCFGRTDCEEGWNCRVVSNTPPDIISICLSPTNRLCSICAVDQDCPGGKCYELDGEQVCGIDCENDDDCPETYSCTERAGSRMCIPRNGSCSCNEDSSGEVRFCEAKNTFGSCYGRETCDPDVGWFGCNAKEPTTELCNGIDDDCNGFTDDIFGLGEPCEREANIGDDSISCLGRIVCTTESLEPICTATTPQEELCNFIDDDCDGNTDEGFEDKGSICFAGQGLCQRIGVYECSEDGTAIRCTIDEALPDTESCDGLDNDCDGSIDEDFPNIGEVCSAGEGACIRTGTWRCADDQSARVCTANARDPEQEKCDNIDNDCDGIVDEDFPNLFESCFEGRGGCERQGFIYCSDDKTSAQCTAIAAEPTLEQCNGRDDDCDTRIDEGFEGVNEPCFVGQGACRNNGITVCTPDGTSIECTATLGAQAEEKCNQIDDDCDGLFDEGFEDLNRPCTNDGLGVCQTQGIYQCTEDGSVLICDAPIQLPVENELCDGLDDDCDGTIDEEFEGLNETCFIGLGTCRRAGLQVCSEDGLNVTCNAEIIAPAIPDQDLCDYKDDDCDGTIDEGYDVNEPCSDGVGACFEAGITVCAEDGASVVCDAERGTPVTEACNNIDDDCDGQTDEAFPNLGKACEAEGLFGICAQGTFVCADNFQDATCLATGTNPVEEQCNGLDDDCDGEVDEDFDGLSEICFAGEGVCRNAGIRTCSDNGEEVVCNAVAGEPNATEICNGFDDNCDGEIDEGFDGLNAPCSAGQGVCFSPGITVCSQDGSEVICDAVAGQGSAEVCNGLDDDCNGQIDDDPRFANLGLPCESDALGVCKTSGVFVCGSDDSLACDAPSVDPRPAELCDGLDDDCDGTADEDFIGGQNGLNQVCTTGVGACERSGITVCNDEQTSVTCNAVAGDEAIEACNRIDDDCDGSTDENFVNLGLGESCSLGQGLCRRNGVLDCNPTDPNAAPVCNADVISPAVDGQDLCDYQDDDCDGIVDEDFVDNAGQYSTVTNCGACGTDCNALWDPSPDAFGLTPTCSQIAGSFQCGYTCLPNRFDNDGVASNGCEFEPDPSAVYVQTPENGGADTPECGSPLAPCATINQGITRAQAQSFPLVLVAEGAYRETVTLVEGINVLGGHQRINWERNPSVFASVIFGNDTINTHKAAVRAENIRTLETRLDGFVINGEPVLFDANSYGVHIIDSNEKLLITNNRIYASNGGIGNDGQSGASGLPGQNGINGQASVLQDQPQICEPTSIRDGGAGGVVSCGDVDSRGGNGGGAICPHFGDQDGSGASGGPAAVGGIGGAGGWTSFGGSSCYVSFGIDSFSGLAGTSGADGNGGLGANTVLGTPSRDWQGSFGGAGVNGGVGGGGGGGGSAAGVEISSDNNVDVTTCNRNRDCLQEFGYSCEEWGYCRKYCQRNTDCAPGEYCHAFGNPFNGVSVTRICAQNPPETIVGASGGGGGSGGCAGTAGLGGQSGGGSFGIYLHFAGFEPTETSDLPRIEGNEIYRGLGGRGGSGGKGGGGGEGGLGGDGGPTGADLGRFAFCSLAGSAGGVGGRGGHAGGGGGGQGGISFDIFISNSNSVTQTYLEDNLLPIPADEETAGIGGIGGNSSNTVIGTGQDGQAGLSGHFAEIP